MSASERFDPYMVHLSQVLGHADRHAGLKGYCTGLMLPLARKSVEPMAARVDPLHASARHQALHHFVAKAQWSDDHAKYAQRYLAEFCYRFNRRFDLTAMLSKPLRELSMTRPLLLRVLRQSEVSTYSGK